MYITRILLQTFAKRNIEKKERKEIVPRSYVDIRLKSFSITRLGQLIGPEMEEGRWPIRRWPRI